ncbi:MAG: hypothetical protein IIX12_05850 [Alistipes sp.]|nr:hypothetical protein [Alistipes sp.]
MKKKRKSACRTEFLLSLYFGGIGKLRQNLTEKQYNYLIFRKILGWLGYRHKIGARAHFGKNRLPRKPIFTPPPKKKQRKVTKKLTKTALRLKRQATTKGPIFKIKAN